MTQLLKYGDQIERRYLKLAWAKLGSTTVTSSPSLTITSPTFTASKFLQVMIHFFGDASNNPLAMIQFNGSSSGYAYRRSTNGGSDDASGINQSSDLIGWNGVREGGQLGIMYIINIQGEEKLIIATDVENTNTGAGNALSRQEWAQKWTGSDQITSVVADGDGSKTFDVSSNLTVLGSEGTFTATLQDGTIFEESDTNKSYIWSSSTNSWTQL